MCEMCQENGNEPVGCQNCGKMICWDYTLDQSDDIMGTPFVTSSGDLYCYNCGIEMERAEEIQMEEDATYYPEYD